MVTEDGHLTDEFVGLSTDDKPTGNIRNGSTFVEMDTQKIFAWDEENERWLELG